MLTHLNYWTNCHDGVDLFKMPAGFRTLVILPVDHSFAHTAGLYIAPLIGMSLYFVDSRGGGIATLRNIPINLEGVDPDLRHDGSRAFGQLHEEDRVRCRGERRPDREALQGRNRRGYRLERGRLEQTAPRDAARAFLPYTLARFLVFNKIRRMVFGNSILYCVGGGALLDVKQQEFFAAFGVPIYQGYGLTEAAPIISSNGPLKHKFGTSGTLCASIECRLLKEDGSEAAIGENAEIVIRGGNVMKGYFKNPEASAEALRDGWLYTGDLAHWDKDGFLVVVGREKALLIAEDGEKYSPEEIEEAVTSSTEVIDQIMAWCEQRNTSRPWSTLDAARVERLIEVEGLAAPMPSWRG